MPQEKDNFDSSTSGRQGEGKTFCETHSGCEDATKESNIDVQSEDSKENVAPRVNKFVFFVFLIVGSVQLLPWNSLLNTMFAILSIIFPDVPAINGSITATYSTVITVSTVLFIMYPTIVVNVTCTHIGMVLSIIIGVLYGIVPHMSSSNVSALYHTLAGLMALAAAVIGSSAFAYAGRFPVNYCGALSAGLGLSGVISFVLWMVSEYAIFSNDVKGTTGANWVVNAVVILDAIFAMILLIILFRKPYTANIFKKKEVVENEDIEDPKKVVSDDSFDEEKPLGTYEQGGLPLVLKKVWWFGLLYVIHMFITLYCFPTIGPLAWGRIQWQSDLLIGVFQIADLVARYAPNAFPFMMVKTSIVTIVIVVRLVFIALFTIPWVYPHNAFFGSFAYQFIIMLLVALSNGWICTCAFVRFQELVEGDEAKSRVASVSLLCTFLGIAAGQWSAYGVTVS